MGSSSGRHGHRQIGRDAGIHFLERDRGRPGRDARHIEVCVRETDARGRDASADGDDRGVRARGADLGVLVVITARVEAGDFDLFEYESGVLPTRECEPTCDLCEAGMLPLCTL